MVLHKFLFMFRLYCKTPPPPKKENKDKKKKKETLLSYHSEICVLLQKAEQSGVKIQGHWKNTKTLSGENNRKKKHNSKRQLC